jgi:hypothetical protein
MIFSFDVYGPEYVRFKNLTPGYFKAMRENGFRMAILKSSMGFGIDRGCQNFVSLLKDYFDIAYYHWCDPTSIPKHQASFLRKQINKFRPKAVFLDVEQRCRDWSLYPNGPKLTPQEIVSNANILLEDLRDLELPLEVYSYPYFVTEYCMGAALPNGETVQGKGYLSNGGWWRDVTWPFPASLRPWIAAYFPTPKKGLKPNTWINFQAMLYTKVLPKSPEFYTHINFFNAGKKVCHRWWQFASNVWLPAFVNVDMSLYNGTDKDYQYWITQTNPPQPQPDPDLPVLVPYHVKHRCNPNVRQAASRHSPNLGMLTAGTEVLISNEVTVNGYLQILSPIFGWVFADYLEKE